MIIYYDCCKNDVCGIIIDIIYMYIILKIYNVLYII